MEARSTLKASSHEGGAAQPLGRAWCEHPAWEPGIKGLPRSTWVIGIAGGASGAGGAGRGSPGERKERQGHEKELGPDPHPLHSSVTL